LRPKRIDPYQSDEIDRTQAALPIGRGQGEFAIGERLPPERELALTLGVSRPSLREALIALEIGGQIEIRMGSGVYVRDTAADAVGPMATLGDSPSELMQARAAVEGSVAALAAARMTAAMLERLRRTVQRMKRLAEAGKSPVEAERQFHMLIAEAARRRGPPRCASTRTCCSRCRPAIRSRPRRPSARIFVRRKRGGSRVG
jgi:DNA-binding transcriptional regulator YhcF (GntR family)